MVLLNVSVHSVGLASDILRWLTRSSIFYGIAIFCCWYLHLHQNSVHVSVSSGPYCSKATFDYQFTYQICSRRNWNGLLWGFCWGFFFLVEVTSMYVALTNKECLSLKEVSWNFETLHSSGGQMELYLTLPYCIALHCWGCTWLQQQDGCSAFPELQFVYFYMTFNECLFSVKMSARLL